MFYNLASTTDSDNPGRHLELFAWRFDATVPDVTGDVPYRPETPDEDDLYPQPVDTAYPA
mgnify:CR=1 FL=1